MEATLKEARDIAEKLTPAEKIRLLKYLAHSLERTGLPKSEPQDLRGIWKDKFPEDFDAEKEIREIRDEWKKKFDDL